MDDLAHAHLDEHIEQEDARGDDAADEHGRGEDEHVVLRPAQPVAAGRDRLLPHQCRSDQSTDQIKYQIREQHVSDRISDHMSEQRKAHITSHVRSEQSTYQITCQIRAKHLSDHMSDQIKAHIRSHVRSHNVYRITYQSNAKHISDHMSDRILYIRSLLRSQIITRYITCHFAVATHRRLAGEMWITTEEDGAV